MVFLLRFFFPVSTHSILLTVPTANNRVLICLLPSSHAESDLDDMVVKVTPSDIELDAVAQSDKEGAAADVPEIVTVPLDDESTKTNNVAT